MKPYRFCIFFIAFICFRSQSQELDAQVIVNSDLVNQTNQQIFKTLERSLNEFINTQVWTDEEFLNNEKITIYGSGNQTRSFCYIDDTVDGLVRLMNNTESIGPINIGNDYEMTILELSNFILQLLPNSKSKIGFQDLPQDDPTKRKPNLILANTILDWKPTTSLEVGLKNTIEYFTHL